MHLVASLLLTSSLKDTDKGPQVFVYFIPVVLYTVQEVHSDQVPSLLGFSVVDQHPVGKPPAGLPGGSRRTSLKILMIEDRVLLSVIPLLCSRL